MWEGGNVSARMYYQVNPKDGCLDKDLARVFGETDAVHLRIIYLRDERQKYLFYDLCPQQH